MGQFGIGQAVRRSEDERLLTGRGRYTGDIDLPGQAYAYFLRSPHAHARIAAIDALTAAALTGVLAVYTAVGRVGARFFAIDNCCPHAGGSLAAGSIEGQAIVCPLHGWNLDVFSGECSLMGAKTTSYPVRVENGSLEVCL